MQNGSTTSPATSTCASSNLLLSYETFLEEYKNKEISRRSTFVKKR
jgi:hypothetical protein